VQFGRAYGSRSSAAPLSREAVFEVLGAAWDAGIRALDTAEAYGAAAERVAAWLDASGNRSAAWVVTKVHVGGSDLAQRARDALSRFEGAGRRCLMTHGPVAGTDWAVVRDRAEEAGAEVGQSIYTPAELTVAATQPGITRIQAPGNVFDLRALEARGPRAVVLDLRSLYLQGTLLESPLAAERRAPGTGPLASAVQSAAAELGVSPGRLLVAAMLQRLGPGDRLVVGVDGVDQLSELAAAVGVAHGTLAFFEARLRSLVPSIARPEALDPRSWPAQASPV
jgi:aryl-alcohol dehydrogenase-like predicted oxidoreductase